MQRSKWLLACCMLLGSCGGDDTGNGGGSTPTPAPTPTATATPTPTPGPTATPLNTGEVKPTSDATYLSATMEMTTTAEASNNLTGQTKSGATMDRSTVLDTPGFAGSYGSTTGYRLADSANAVTFGPGQFVSDTTGTDKYYPTVLFRKSAPPVDDYLALYKILITSTSVKGSGTVEPVYAGNGGWQHTVSSGGTARTRLDYFAYGPATPESGMPRSGIVKFSLAGSGNYAGATDLYYISHLNEVTVDFGAGTVSGMITGGGTNFFTNGFGGVFAFTFAGAINGNSTSGNIKSDVAVASGQFRILFVGPNADELIVTYVGQDGRGSYVGSSVGVRNPYL